MSMGMTPEQFWNGDPGLARYYRKADEINRERRNQDLWWQGMYVYEAICSASPVLHAFAKKGTKPHPYPEEPHPITRRSQVEAKQTHEEREYKKGKKMMEAFMIANNLRMAAKKQEEGSEVAHVDGN